MYLKAEFRIYWSFILILFSRNVVSVKKYVFEITMQYKSPDCVERPVTLINGQFPGPIIRLKVGEALEVEVKNLLATDAVTIHWHGQKQQGTVWQDGIGMISNCPIPPKTSFTYRFTVNSEPGTFFYHGHVGGIRSAGLYGMLIIDRLAGKSFAYDEERSVLLNDWYHASHTDLVTGLLEEKFRWTGDPQSILINGKGYYNCTKNGVPVNSNYPYYKPDSTVYCSDPQCPGHEIITVPVGKTIRLRLGNIAELSFLNIAIQGHNMTIVEADGQRVSPIEVQSLDINSGQRYSVLINTTMPVNAYWISVRTRHRRGVVTGKAILKYAGASSNTSSIDYQTVFASQPTWDDIGFSFKQQSSIKGLTDAPANDKITKRIVLLGTQERYSWKTGEAHHNHTLKRPEEHCNSTDRHLRWAMNGVSYKFENTPVAHMVHYGIRKSSLSEQRGYYTINHGDVVDVVIQNYPACNQVCEQHPWHLHGHKFWIVGMGKGQWNGTSAELASLDPKGALKRDTTTVIPDAEKPYNGQPKQGGCGWVAIRFVADNPGVWPLHCHVTWHFVMGMQVVFLESTEKMPAPGSDIPICGDVTPAVWMQKENLVKKTAVQTCGELVHLWIGLVVGWCFSFGLIIVIIFFCCKTQNSKYRGNSIEINMEALKT